MPPKRHGWRPERDEELRSQAAALKSALAEAKKQLRQKKRAEKTKLRQWQLAPESAEGEVCSAHTLPQFAQVALILFDLADCRANAAAAFLAQQAAIFHWEDRPQATVQELVDTVNPNFYSATNRRRNVTGANHQLMDDLAEQTLANTTQKKTEQKLKKVYITT